jgi:hypothetical protein
MKKSNNDGKIKINTCEVSELKKEHVDLTRAYIIILIRKFNDKIK